MECYEKCRIMPHESEQGLIRLNKAHIHVTWLHEPHFALTVKVGVWPQKAKRRSLGSGAGGILLNMGSLSSFRLGLLPFRFPPLLLSCWPSWDGRLMLVIPQKGRSSSCVLRCPRLVAGFVFVSFCLCFWTCVCFPDHYCCQPKTALLLPQAAASLPAACRLREQAACAAC